MGRGDKTREGAGLFSGLSEKLKRSQSCKKNWFLASLHSCIGDILRFLYVKIVTEEVVMGECLCCKVEVLC